jgi:hypothetical protein
MNETPAASNLPIHPSEPARAADLLDRFFKGQSVKLEVIDGIPMEFQPQDLVSGRDLPTDRYTADPFTLLDDGTIRSTIRPNPGSSIVVWTGIGFPIHGMADGQVPDPGLLTRLIARAGHRVEEFVNAAPEPVRNEVVFLRFKNPRLMPAPIGTEVMRSVVEARMARLPVVEPPAESAMAAVKRALDTVEGLLKMEQQLAADAGSAKSEQIERLNQMATTYRAQIRALSSTDPAAPLHSDRKPLALSVDDIRHRVATFQHAIKAAGKTEFEVGSLFGCAPGAVLPAFTSELVAGTDTSLIAIIEHELVTQGLSAIPNGNKAPVRWAFPAPPPAHEEKLVTDELPSNLIQFPSGGKKAAPPAEPPAA